MKSIYKLLTMALLTASMLAMPFAAYASDSVYGSAAAAADEDVTLEEMLTYAIQDEYAAQAEYEAIMDKFGTARPYSNIIRSEATHISLLLPLFERLSAASENHLKAFENSASGTRNSDAGGKRGMGRFGGNRW